MVIRFADYLYQVDNVKKKCNDNLCGLMTQIRTLELVSDIVLRFGCVS